MPTAAHLLRLARDAAPTDGPAPADTELLQRYVSARDEAAFAELVRRNGPLVLRACRHILGESGADDAFQATFLLLVRSARWLTRPGSLAGWLHAAAVRIATNARRGEERRRKRERSRPIRSASPDDLTWGEVREVLDREIAALPESYRLPVVLCHIQELGYEEAARRAGCPVGALRGRLERGKDQLRKRLARYGLPLAAPALVLGAPPPVSAALVEATLRVVCTGMNGAVPPALAGLLRTTGGLRMALFVTPAAAILAALGAVIAASALAPKPPKSDPASALRSYSSPTPVPVVDANGDPLPAGAVMRLGTTRFRHGEWVRSVAFSPDGMQIASASFDNTVRIWDRATGKELRRLKGPYLEPHTVLYVDGGKQIVTAEGWYSGREANPVRIWDAQSGQLVRILVERGPRTNDALVVSTDGKKLAYSIDDRVIVSPCDGGGRTETLPAGGRRVGHLAFSADGNRLLVCSSGDFLRNTPPDEPFGVRMFDLSKPTLAGQVREPVWRREGKYVEAGGKYPAATFSPDGKRVLVSFNYKEQAALLDVDTGKELFRLAGKHVAIHPFLFLPDGKRVFTLTASGPGTVWDITTGKPVVEWPGVGVDVLGGAALSPDGKTVVTAGHRAVRLWDVDTGLELSVPAGANGDVDRLEYFSDGRRILAGSYWDRDSGARVWDTATAQQLASCPRQAASTALARDGRTFAVGYHNGTPDLVDAATGRVLRIAKGDPVFLDSLAYSLDGKLLIGTGWADGSIRLWEAETLKPLQSIDDAFPRGGGTRSLVVSRDNASLVTAGLDGVVRVWDLAARKEVRRFTVGETGDWKVAVSADGRFALTGLARERYGFGTGGAKITTDVKLWELATGNARLTISGPKDGANCLGFSPDGRTVAVGSEDCITRIYELATGNCRCELRGHDGPVTAVAFSPDGRRLLTGCSDTTILVWDLIRPAAVVPLQPSDAAAAWAVLLDADATGADQAIRSLITSPDAALAHLKKHLKAEVGPDPKRLRELVEQLRAPAFLDREKAHAELGRIGAAAVPALREAVRAAESPEVVRRAGELVAKLDRPILNGEPLRRLRAVEVLERIGSADARKLLTELSGGAPGVRLTEEAKQALERIGRR